MTLQQAERPSAVGHSEEKARSRQRDEALTRANRVRSARAELKQQLKQRELTIADVLRAVPPEAATAQVGDVLVWAPTIGPSRMRKLCRGVCRPDDVLERLPAAAREMLVRRVG